MACTLPTHHPLLALQDDMLLTARTPLPCQSNPDRFLQPGEDDNWFDSDEARQAIAACHACPARRECAEAALSAGTVLWDDGKILAAAWGVIQAGVACRGDHATWEKLAAAAGRSGHVCRMCLRPFTEVQHQARGLCSGCHTATRRANTGDVAPSRPRFVPPPNCVDCDRPMVRASQPVPEGYVRHGTKGRCHSCDMARRRRMRVAA